MDTIKEAFLKVCAEAKPASSHYVSLYCDDRFYGGPEEGGWYGTDTALVASQEVYSLATAVQVKANVLKLAKELTAEAERARNQQCANEMEWLDARGLDADYLPEPNGGSVYWVTIEGTVGSHVRLGDRCYS